MKIFTITRSHATGRTIVAIDGTKDRHTYTMTPAHFEAWVAHVRANGHTATVRFI